MKSYLFIRPQFIINFVKKESNLILGKEKKSVK
jgi:hypothetical protein